MEKNNYNFENDNKDKWILNVLKTLPFLWLLAFPWCSQIQNSIKNSVSDTVNFWDKKIEKFSENIRWWIIDNYLHNISKIANEDIFLSKIWELDFDNDIKYFFPYLSNYDKMKNFNNLDEKKWDPFLKMFDNIFENSSNKEEDMKILRREFSWILFNKRWEVQKNKIFAIYLIKKASGEIPNRSDLTWLIWDNWNYIKYPKISFESRKIIDQFSSQIIKNLPYNEKTLQWNIVMWVISTWLHIAQLPWFFVDRDIFDSFNVNENLKDNFAELEKIINEIENRDEDIRYNWLTQNEKISQEEINHNILNSIYYEVLDIKNFLIDKNFFQKAMVSDKEDFWEYLNLKVSNLTNFISNSDEKELTKSDKSRLLLWLSILLEESLIYNNALRNQVLILCINLLILI